MSIRTFANKKLILILLSVIAAMLVAGGTAFAVFAGSQDNEKTEAENVAVEETEPEEHISVTGDSIIPDSYKLFTLFVPKPDGWGESEYDEYGVIEVRQYDKVLAEASREDAVADVAEKDVVVAEEEDDNELYALADVYQNAKTSKMDESEYAVVQTIDNVKMNNEYKIVIPTDCVIPGTMLEVVMVKPMLVKASNGENSIPITISPVEYIITEKDVADDAEKTEDGEQDVRQLATQIVFIARANGEDVMIAELGQEGESESSEAVVVENGNGADTASAAAVGQNNSGNKPSSNGGTVNNGSDVNTNKPNTGSNTNTTKPGGNTNTNKPSNPGNVTPSNPTPTPTPKPEKKNVWKCACGAKFYSEIEQYNHSKEMAIYCLNNHDESSPCGGDCKHNYTVVTE